MKRSTNLSRTTYRYDGMNRQDYEKREDWMSDPDPAFVQTYLIEQEYDKKGNRTRLDRNVTSGHETEYGQSMDLGYTYNTVNALTAISDADDANYECTVTCDANNNITLVEEAVSTGGYTAELATAFSYDWANRMETNTVSRYLKASKDMVYTKREHEYDGAGRLVNSTYKNWLGGEEEPEGDTVEHCYAGSKHVQNTDGSSSYGEPWHWAGAQNAHAAPLKSPNPDTASQAAFNISNDKTPQRTTWQDPTTAGDERNLYGQGKPMAKDSSGSGSDWSTGIESESPDSVAVTINSRFDFDGTVAATDLDRATDAREKSRIGIFGSALSYAGSSGRVTSEPLGRDVNPLGRGSGAALVGGAMNLGILIPRLPASVATTGTGDSINNCGQCGGGGCGDVIPPKPGDPGYNPDPYFDAPLPPWLKNEHLRIPQWNPWLGEKESVWDSDEEQQLILGNDGIWRVQPPSFRDPFENLPVPPPAPPRTGLIPLGDPEPPREKTPLPFYWKEPDKWGNCPPGYKKMWWPDPTYGLRQVCVPTSHTWRAPEYWGDDLNRPGPGGSDVCGQGGQPACNPPVLGEVTEHYCTCNKSTGECAETTQVVKTTNAAEVDGHKYIETPRSSGCFWDVRNGMACEWCGCGDI